MTSLDPYGNWERETTSPDASPCNHTDGWTVVTMGHGTRRCPLALQANTGSESHPVRAPNYYQPLLQSINDKSIAIDSGASDGFGDTDTPGTHRVPTQYGVTMASATGDSKTSIATDVFDLPLPAAALPYHVFKKGDVQRPLLSVGKVCDAGCDVTFHQTHCDINKDGERLLKGYRDPRTGLYLLPTTVAQRDNHTLPTNGHSLGFRGGDLH